MALHDDWTRLLSDWAEQLEQASIRPQLTSGFVAATDTAVAATEARLAVRLPPSLRAFYAITDGWPDSGVRFGVTGLRPVEDVGWFRDLERGWLAAWAADPDGDNPDVALMRRALVLSTPGEAAVLLDPAAIDPVTGEWRACLFDNDVPGAHGRSATCFEVVERVYARFLASNGLTARPSAGAPDPVDEAYRRLLAGDRTAEPDVERYRQLYGWRAWVLHFQIEAFARSREPNWTGHGARYLWNSASIAGADLDQTLADWVITQDIMPAMVVSTSRRDRADEPRLAKQAAQEGFPERTPAEIEQRIRERMDRLVDSQPAPVTALLRTLRTRDDADGGLVADFSYAPEFAAAADEARAALPTDPVAAWDVLIAALPSWEPATPNHVAPLGLLWDRDLSQLFRPGPGLRAILANRRVVPGDSVLATPRAFGYR